MTGTNTTRLSLYKPDGDDDIDVTTDLNNNYDRLDVLVGTTVCTSSTRPNAPYSGQSIYETDTGRLYVCNGTSPASASWKDPVSNGFLSTNITMSASAGTVTVLGDLLVSRPLSTSSAFDAQVVGDSVARFDIAASGSLEWGSGSATRDVNLYRSGANALKTDDTLQVGGDLTVTGVGQRLFAYKTADETVTSSVTPQNDDHLTLALAANATYLMNMNLMVVNAGDFTGDILARLAYPTGTTAHVTGIGAHNTGLTSGSQSTGEWIARQGQTGTASTSTPYGVGTSAVGIKIEALILVGSTAGSLTLQWAQNTSESNGTTVKAGSWMKLERVA